MSLEARDWVDRAYKKLKHTAYFDKTQLPLVDKLVEFEKDKEKFNANLDKLTKALDSMDGDEWEDLVSDIIDKMDILVYPKKLQAWTDSHVIFNTDNEPVRMEKAQYFIDLNVFGHLLGVLWVLTVGAQLDDRRDPEQAPMYEHSYGNRLRKTLYNDKDEITYSPYLFEPYFSQYQRWRDTALTYAEQRLDAKQDALILTLDLRSFFYSVHISKTKYDHILDNKDMKQLPSWTKRVHEFVYTVLEVYSNKLREIHNDKNQLDLGQRVFLPIGFFPSNILSNWVLTPFDEAIVDYINPVYYGRYVDDIIIVDKVEKRSYLQSKARGRSDEETEDLGKLTVNDVIKFYFCSRNDKADRKDGERSQVILESLSVEEMTRAQKAEYNIGDEKRGDERYAVYRINPELLLNSEEMDDENAGDDKDAKRPDVQIQNDKVKVFYFREGSTRALLDCFRTEIGSHASEFRFLPDMDRLLERNDYSEIFKLYNTATPNKLNGVTQVELDRFSLSKFLGKYRKAGSLIHDRKENAFDRDLLSIFDKRTLIENYILWERLLEIMIVNDRFDSYEKLVKKIMKAIEEYEIPTELLKQADNLKPKTSLLQTLRAAVFRTSALCQGGHIQKIWENIGDEWQKRFSELPECCIETDLTSRTTAYRRSRMVNKYVLPLPIGWVDEERLASTSGVNLCRLKDFSGVLDLSEADKVDYDYYPYMFTPQEISHALTYLSMARGQGLLSAKEHKDRIDKNYKYLNYPNLRDEKDNRRLLEEVDAAPLYLNDQSTCSIYVKTPHLDKLKVAIGNARLDRNDFKRALTGKENRSFIRYQQLCSLFGAALKEKTDLLVLPECYIPWEWIPNVASLCARNGMALITGVEPVLSVIDQEDREGIASNKRKVYNLTAVILPYQHENYKYAHVVYHHKTQYSPEEKRTIAGYGLESVEGDEYQLYCWKDIWFSVYCCYELASIRDRALFQSYADLVVAVEWNKDVSYFSSIMESMCRDIHCYCIQVNSSDYGDSRILSPSKTALRDIIQTKGGDNYTIMAADIDIQKLREHQRKGYELQRDTEQFKPTPPGLDVEIISKKQAGTLWESILLSQKR